MASEKQLIIAYSGSLDAYCPKPSSGIFSKFRQWFWTYKHDTVDSSTRTAYYMIKAVKALKDDYCVTPAEIKIMLWGKIDPLNKVHAIEHGVEDFFSFGPYLPKRESLKQLEDADVLFLPLEKSNIKGKETLFIPGKMFEYLHIGKPILALCEVSDCKRILELSGLGICIEPDNPVCIENALLGILRDRTILSNLKPNKKFIETFSFINKTAELASVFDKLYVD